MNMSLLNRGGLDASPKAKRMDLNRSHVEGTSNYRDYLRDINWKLIVFCVALWWFIYSAPTEGLFTSHFWSASNASQSDDF
jgi:hypothetical protein